MDVQMVRDTGWRNTTQTLTGELGNSLGKKKTVHGDILRSKDAMRRIILLNWQENWHDKLLD